MNPLFGGSGPTTIPGVWFFCGTTADYHQPTDTEDRVDYAKMERVTKLVCYATLEVGNKPALLNEGRRRRLGARCTKGVV